MPQSDVNSEPVSCLCIFYPENQMIIVSCSLYALALKVFERNPYIFRSVEFSTEVIKCFFNVPVDNQ